MTIYFCNNTELDIDALLILGVNVKQNDNPIGFFGTGSKFAIATLLRTNHSIDLYLKGEKHTFLSREKIIRGKPFSLIVLRYPSGEERELGFTTDLGKQWEVWQAYRELHSNVLDEGGTTITQTSPETWQTCFVITGEGIEKAFTVHNEIFLSSSSLLSNDRIALHPRPNPHIPTSIAYYRGVRAHSMRRPALFTYNLLYPATLTEDRTITNSWLYETLASDLIAKCTDREILHLALTAESGTFEAELHYEGREPSKEFLSLCEENRNNLHFNQSAISLWKEVCKPAERFNTYALNSFEAVQLKEACRLIHLLDEEVDLANVTFVRSLGAGIFGAVQNGRILIARQTFDRGLLFLTSTLYEEVLHTRHNFRDESRELQDFLFDRLISTLRELDALKNNRE